MRKCTGTGYDIDHCRGEKMGCPGCAHYQTEECPKVKKQMEKEKEN